MYKYTHARVFRSAPHLTPKGIVGAIAESPSLRETMSEAVPLGWCLGARAVLPFSEASFNTTVVEAGFLLERPRFETPIAPPPETIRRVYCPFTRRVSTEPPACRMATSRGSCRSERQCGPCPPGAAWIMARARRTLRLPVGLIYEVPASTGGALVEGALDAESPEHGLAVRGGTVVPRPVREAGAAAVRVVASSRTAAVVRAELIPCRVDGEGAREGGTAGSSSSQAVVLGAMRGHKGV